MISGNKRLSDRWRSSFSLRGVTCAATLFMLAGSALAWKNSDEARSAATAALERVQAASRQMDAARETITQHRKALTDFVAKGADTRDIDRQLTAIHSEMRLVNDAKWAALNQMRQGLFCSQCKNTKDVIESSGKETFEQHLERVQGHVIPATQEQLDEKAKVYDAQYAELKAHADEFYKQRSAIVAEFNKQVRGKEEQTSRLQSGWSDLNRERSAAVTAYHAAQVAADCLEASERMTAASSQRANLETVRQEAAAIRERLAQSRIEQARKQAEIELAKRQVEGSAATERRIQELQAQSRDLASHVAQLQQQENERQSQFIKVRDESLKQAARDVSSAQKDGDVRRQPQEVILGNIEQSVTAAQGGSAASGESLWRTTDNSEGGMLRSDALERARQSMEAGKADVQKLAAVVSETGDWLGGIPREPVGEFLRGIGDQIWHGEDVDPKKVGVQMAEDRMQERAKQMFHEALRDIRARIQTGMSYDELPTDKREDMQFRDEARRLITTDRNKILDFYHRWVEEKVEQVFGQNH